jgi:hypothetical protein
MYRPISRASSTCQRTGKESNFNKYPRRHAPCKHIQTQSISQWSVSSGRTSMVSGAGLGLATASLRRRISSAYTMECPLVWRCCFTCTHVEISTADYPSHKKHNAQDHHHASVARDAGSHDTLHHLITRRVHLPQGRGPNILVPLDARKVLTSSSAAACHPGTIAVPGRGCNHTPQQICHTKAMRNSYGSSESPVDGWVQARVEMNMGVVCSR